MKIRSRKGIAFSALYASLYYAVSTLLGPLSFGQLNIRLSNALLGIVPIAGMPAVVGQTVGVLITNVTSPLGPIDMINTVPSFLCSLLIWKLRRVSVLLGFLIYTITLGFTVSWILSSVLNIPFLQSFVFVTAGIGFVVILIGYTFYRALLKAGVERYFG